MTVQGQTQYSSLFNHKIETYTHKGDSCSIQMISVTPNYSRNAVYIVPIHYNIRSVTTKIAAICQAKLTGYIVNKQDEKILWLTNRLNGEVNDSVELRCGSPKKYVTLTRDIKVEFMSDETAKNLNAALLLWRITIESDSNILNEMPPDLEAKLSVLSEAISRNGTVT